MQKFAFLDILKQPWMVNWKILIHDAKNNTSDRTWIVRKNTMGLFKLHGLSKHYLKAVKSNDEKEKWSTTTRQASVYKIFSGDPFSSKKPNIYHSNTWECTRISYPYVQPDHGRSESHPPGLRALSFTFLLPEN